MRSALIAAAVLTPAAAVPMTCAMTSAMLPAAHAGHRGGAVRVGRYLGADGVAADLTIDWFTQRSALTP